MNIDNDYGRPKRIIARNAVRLLAAGRFNAYQPIIVDGRTITEGSRDSGGTIQRTDALLPVLDEVGARTVLDLGSAEGYVARRCAEAGYATLGVEQDIRRLMLAQWSTSLDGLHGIGFWRLRLDVESVSLLPEMDATVCLSVLHHIIGAKGLEYGEHMLATLRAKTRSVMIFEMGQSNETERVWARRLPDMGDDPHAWIADWLRRAGFSEVRRICEVSAWKSDVTRATFAAFA